MACRIVVAAHCPDEVSSMSTARPVSGAGAAGDVAASFQAVQHAGQCGGAGACGRAEFGHGPAPAVGQVRQRVDLGGGQVQVDEFRGENLQSGMGGPLQCEQGRPSRWHGFGLHDYELYDFVVPTASVGHRSPRR
jgi:hypothetical protein